MKKLKTLLLMLTCVICFTACGSGEVKTIDYNENQIKSQVETVYSLISYPDIKNQLKNEPQFLGLNDDGSIVLSSIT